MENEIKNEENIAEQKAEVNAENIADEKQELDSENLLVEIPGEIEISKEEISIKEKKDSKEKKENKPSKKFNFYGNMLIVFFIILIAIGLLAAVGYVQGRNKSKALSNLSLSDYTKKTLVYKEIDFSKVLIFGTESEDSDKDSMVLYFTKGTASIRFTGLDRLEVDFANTDLDKKELHLIYEPLENEAEIPVDVEIIYDENKCREIEKINASPMDSEIFNKTKSAVLTTLGTAGGSVLGKIVGGMFGIKGKLIGVTAGAALGGVGGYIFSSSFCKEVKLVKDITSADIVTILEEAKPVIAAQLLWDDASSESSEQKAVVDLEYMKNKYQKELVAYLNNLICSGNSEWKSVAVTFIDEKGDAE